MTSRPKKTAIFIWTRPFWLYGSVRMQLSMALRDWRPVARASPRASSPRSHPCTPCSDGLHDTMGQGTIGASVRYRMSFVLGRSYLAVQCSCLRRGSRVKLVQRTHPDWQSDYSLQISLSERARDIAKASCERTNIHLIGPHVGIDPCCCSPVENTPGCKDIATILSSYRRASSFDTRMFPNLD